MKFLLISKERLPTEVQYENRTQGTF